VCRAILYMFRASVAALLLLSAPALAIPMKNEAGDHAVAVQASKNDVGAEPAVQASSCADVSTKTLETRNCLWVRGQTACDSTYFISRRNGNVINCYWSTSSYGASRCAGQSTNQAPCALPCASRTDSDSCLADGTSPRWSNWIMRNMGASVYRYRQATYPAGSTGCIWEQCGHTCPYWLSGGQGYAACRTKVWPPESV
jgi:hypothetical protein